MDNKDKNMQTEQTPTTSNGSDFFVDLMMAAFTVIMGYALLWGVVSNVPLPSYHQHTDTCYNVQEELTCGREEGELVLKENPLPGPIDLIIAVKAASAE